MLVWYTSWRRACQGRQPRQLRHHIPREDRHDLVLHWLATIDREGNRPLLASAALFTDTTSRTIDPLPQLAARVDPKIWRLGFLDTRGPPMRPTSNHGEETTKAGTTVSRWRGRSESESQWPPKRRMIFAAPCS
jgi:hypothetical protein